jgi:hypothetical protein
MAPVCQKQCDPAIHRDLWQCNSWLRTELLTSSSPYCNKTEDAINAGEQMTLINNNKHTSSEVGSISKSEPNLQLLNIVLLVLLTCEIYKSSSADRIQNFCSLSEFLSHE